MNGHTKYGYRKRADKHKSFVSKAALGNTLVAALLAAALAALILRGGKNEEYEYREDVWQPIEEHSAQVERTEAPMPTEQEETPGSVYTSYALDSREIVVSINGVARRMPLEDYLVGVVAAEMPVSAEPEALKAQAVAARTFTALHAAGGAKCTHGAEGCTVCSDPYCCQAYASREQLMAAWGSQYDENMRKIERAVRDTEGIVLLYEGRLISALYHASSGKATESSEAVFAVAQPYLVSVDSLEGDSEAVSVQSFGTEELIKTLNSAFPEANLKAPLSQEDISVWGRTDSGRVQLVRVGETVVTGQMLRSLLGLKSTAFTVGITTTGVSFTCEGYGHGVGMSQYGAIAMAKEGYDYLEILCHYYTGAEPARLTYAG